MTDIISLASIFETKKKKQRAERLIKKQEEKKEEDEKIQRIIDRHDSNLEYWNRIKDSGARPAQDEYIGYDVDEKYIKKLRENGLTFNTINNIVQKEKWYEPRTWITNVLKNPYNFALCYPHRLTFDRCEKIRDYENLDIPNEVRSFAFIKFQLIKGSKGGPWKLAAGVFTPYTKFKDAYEKWCENVPMIPVYEQINKLSYHCVIDKVKYVTSVDFHNMGRNIEQFLENLSLVNPPSKITKKKVEQMTHKGIKLNDEQVQACVNALTKSVSIITGPGGTGKSTIIDIIVKGAEKNKVVLCAPTGLAAAVLSAKTNKKAYTLHKYFWTKKLFYAQHPELDKKKNKRREYEGVIVIFDEMSMVDISLLNMAIDRLKEFVEQDIPIQIVFVGDPKQLPPIGVGRPFRDLLEYSKFPKTILTKIMRQKDEKFLNSITQIRNYEIADEHDDFIVHDCKTDKISEKIIAVIKKNKYKIGKNCQVLTVQKDYMGGTHELNRSLQEFLNPMGSEVTCNNNGCLNQKWCSMCGRQGKYMFRENDRILQTVNDYSKEIYIELGGAMDMLDDGELVDGVKNGMLGRIEQIIPRLAPAQDILLIKFDDLEANRYVKYTLPEANKNLMSAYCLTVDKYQGCQNESIILIMSKAHIRWEQPVAHKLLYTGGSRAEKKCEIIGQRKLFWQTAMTSRTIHAITSLFQDRDILDINEDKNHTCLDKYDYLIEDD